MTNLRFELLQNSLTLRAVSYTDADGDYVFDANEVVGSTVDTFRAAQNGDIAQGWTSLVSFGVVDTADTGRFSGYVDRFFVDQGEGIGVRDGTDESLNSADRKRVDGDERMMVGLGETEDLILGGRLVLDRVTSTDGATVTLYAVNDGTIVAEKSFAVTVVNGRATLDFGAADFGWKVFDSIQIGAGDADTRFTFRSVDFRTDALDGDSLGEVAGTSLTVSKPGNSLNFTVRILDEEAPAGQQVAFSQTVGAAQNGTAPELPYVTLTALDSPDTGRFPLLTDTTWVDQGEGVGVQDGTDLGANSQLRKRIDGDERLVIALDEGYATKGSIAFSRIEGIAGNDVEIVLRKDGVEVFKAQYDLAADATPDFGGVIFDTVEVGALGSAALAWSSSTFGDLL